MISGVRATARPAFLLLRQSVGKIFRRRLLPLPLLRVLGEREVALHDLDNPNPYNEAQAAHASSVLPHAQFPALCLRVHDLGGGGACVTY